MDCASYAYAINDSDQVVGMSLTRLADGYLHDHAFLYDSGIMIDLGTLVVHGESSARGINASGQVVGQSGRHAFLYTGGVMSDLGTLGGGLE